MTRSIRWTKTLASVALAVTIGATGCATVRQAHVRETEDLLTEAGFARRDAETTEQYGDREPLQLLSRTKDGAVEYLYADPTTCKCVYVGGGKEYAEYRRLLRQQQLVREWRWGDHDPWIGRRSMGGPEPWRPWW